MILINNFRSGTKVFHYRHPLDIVAENGLLTDRFIIGSQNKLYYPIIQLPENMTCSQCILQVKFRSFRTYFRRFCLHFGSFLVDLHNW
jgi:hypothetical protein